jgi:DNA-binding NarL/FixJ family response regulator
METLKERGRVYVDLDSLLKNNKELIKKNVELSEDRNKLKNTISKLKKGRENHKSKQTSKTRLVVEMLLDGVLDLTDYEVADRLFISVSCVKTMKSAIRRERK